MAGPTVAGSIVGKLKMDSSDWDAKLAAAKAQADELGRSDPTIRIDVDSAAAIGKMAEAKAAEELLAGSADKTTSALDRQNASNSSGLSRWKLIAGAIAALIPLMAPLAGYAVGVGGALAGMGAAGVLAIIGIKQAMDQGTTAGHIYSTELQSLKGDLNGLAATSAGAMLGSFQQSVKLISSDMPALNSQISVFSRMLGDVGTTLLQGVLNSFKVLNPLFVQAGQYVQDLADGFKRWTEDGGLQRFASYAQQALPQVADTLGSLASAALRIIEALAPLGGATLVILKSFGDAISGLPDGVLLELSVAALAAVVAFKGWPALVGVVEKVTGSLVTMSAAEDAVKLSSAGMIGGIAGIGAALAIFAGQALDAGRVALGLQQNVDTLGKSIAQSNLKGLQQDTHVAVLGIGTDVSQLGQFVNSGWASGFLKNVGDIYHGVLQINPVFKALGFEGSDLSGHMTDLDAAMANLVSSGHTKQAEAAYKALAAQTDGSKEAIANLKGYLPNYEAAIKGAGSSTDDAAGKFKGVGSSAEAAADAIDKLAQKVAGFGQTQLAESQAQIAYKQSVDDASASIAQNGASLDLSTAAGRANMTALNDIASSTTSLVSAQIANHDSTEAVTASMASGRAAFIAAAEAAGDTASQANALADQLGLVPRNVDIAIGTSGVGPTLQQIQDVKNQIAGIDRNIQISVSMYGAANLATTGGLKVANADGNMYVNGAKQAFADGGFASGIYAGRPGGIHKFAEQETGWEAYISGKPGQESRNAGIALKALGKLGYQTPAPQYAQAPSLSGLTISGTLDLGNGLTGQIRGVVQQEMTQQGTALSNGVRPLA